MTDREMLELAAKAAGVEIEWRRSAGAYYYDDPETGREEWRPLDDDGQTLRLAVKLCIDVSHDAIGMKSFVYARTVFNDETHIGLSEIFDDESERLDRTRRAITRAAAQIGKEME